MRKKSIAFIRLTFFTLAIIILFSVPPGNAMPIVQLTNSTIPVKPAIESTVLDILTDKRPGGNLAQSYAITNITERADSSLAVSVAGIHKAPGEDWDLLEDAVWAGYLDLSPIGDRYIGDIHATIQQTNPITNTEFIFPWYPGTILLYGELGVHEDWGRNSVDFVGGHGCSNCAPNMAYAPKAACIVNVCRDSKQVTIFLDTDTMIFAHLQDFQQTEGQCYEQGAAIGPLVLGPIPELYECGHAFQQETHWHIHWGFNHSWDTFTVESWTLDTNTDVWTQAGTYDTVEPEEWMLAEWNGTPGGPPIIPPGGGNLPPLPPGGVANFWDLVIGGVSDVITGIVASVFPEHEQQFISTFAENAATPIMGLLYVFVFSNIDMTVPLMALGIIVSVELAHFALAIWRLILKIIPMGN